MDGASALCTARHRLINEPLKLRPEVIGVSYSTYPACGLDDVSWGECRFIASRLNTPVRVIHSLAVATGCLLHNDTWIYYNDMMNIDAPLPQHPTVQPCRNNVRRSSRMFLFHLPKSSSEGHKETVQ